MVELYAIPETVLTGPTPPAGSDYDQSTLNGIDTGVIIAGEIAGNPSDEHYLSQKLANDRTPITGYGGFFRYTGSCTEPLIVGIASTQINPNDENAQWLAVGQINPSQLEPDMWYYVYATFPEAPIDYLPNQSLYMVAATNQAWDGNIPPDKAWVWGAFSTAPYPRGSLSHFNGSAWTPFSPELDASFWTWTETEAPPPNCEDYTNQTDCENAGCYWWSDGTCHSTSETPPQKCEEYTNQTGCLAAGCYWYKKYLWESEKCHSAEQNMMMDYLPFIIAGVGGTIVILALLTKERAPAPYYPPPEHYYPPKPTHY